MGTINSKARSKAGQRAVGWLTKDVRSIAKYEHNPARAEALARALALFGGMPNALTFDFVEGSEPDEDGGDGVSEVALVWNHSGRVIDREYLQDGSRAAVAYASALLAERNRDVARFSHEMTRRTPVMYAGAVEEAWTSRRRRNPSVPCAASKKLDRYRKASVLHGGEWVDLDGCYVTSTGTHAYHGKRRATKRGTTVSKRAVRQKASRTPSRVKGVRARKRR